MLCGEVELLRENTAGEHVGHTLKRGHHSVRGEGHGYLDLAEIIVYRYGQVKPLLIVTVDI